MQKVSQHIAEAVIPLLGFYLWDWNWYFILLFYILDGIAKEIIIHLKAKKIYATQGGSSSIQTWKGAALKSLGISFITVVTLHFMYSINHENTDFVNEIVLFLSYKEMGIAQGWVLVPLIGLNVWMQYKFNFLKFGLHTKIILSKLWGEHVKIRLFYLWIVIIGLGVHSVFQLTDSVFVWASIAAPILYSFLIQKSN